MDEAMLFRRPLTAEEIRSLFERARITTRSPDSVGEIVTPPERPAAASVTAVPSSLGRRSYRALVMPRAFKRSRTSSIARGASGR